MRRCTFHAVRLTAFAASIGLVLAGGTAGAAPGPPPTPVQCTVSGAGYVFGTTGNDVICASSGDDHIYGFGGNDAIYAGAGNDVIYAGSGNDSIYASTGADELFGDAGLGDHLYAKDRAPWDTLHDPDGAWYQADVWWPPEQGIPTDDFDFTGPPANYHWIT